MLWLITWNILIPFRCIKESFLFKTKCYAQHQNVQQWQISRIDMMVQDRKWIDIILSNFATSVLHCEIKRPSITLELNKDASKLHRNVWERQQQQRGAKWREQMEFSRHSWRMLLQRRKSSRQLQLQSVLSRTIKFWTFKIKMMMF